VQALSDFAEFVEKQQELRYPRAKPSTSTSAQPATEHHEELDILDSLNFNDSEPEVPLRELLLPSADRQEASQAKLTEHVAERLTDGHGEAVFDLGFENNGESMQLTRAEWDSALARLKEAAKEQHADCNVLLTKNVGGDKEAESTAAGSDSKDKDCTSKILIRRAPTAVEDVIETRIAVVGNGQ
jgi:GTPase